MVPILLATFWATLYISRLLLFQNRPSIVAMGMGNRKNEKGNKVLWWEWDGNDL